MTISSYVCSRINTPNNYLNWSIKTATTFAGGCRAALLLARAAVGAGAGLLVATAAGCGQQGEGEGERGDLRATRGSSHVTYLHDEGLGELRDLGHCSGHASVTITRTWRHRRESQVSPG